MKNRIVLLFFIFSSINLFAETSLLEYSDSLDPLLEDVRIIYQDDKKNEDGYTIILDAVHSYMYEETQITILISDNLEYEISSGLIEL